MILIYWTAKVWSAVAALCDHYNLAYDIRDYREPLVSYDAYDTIIPSPGVPSHHPVYATGKVVSELDFACGYLPKWFRVVAITGTDGKSTTSWIMYSILEKEYFGKKSVYLSGNFDVPFSATVLDILKKWEKKGIIVVEISSFMAYSLQKFQADYSIFTNFKPDHLNWHTDLQEYFHAKMNLIRHTTKMSVVNQQVIEYARGNNLIINISWNIRWYHSQGNILPLQLSSGSEMIQSYNWTDGESIIISWRRKYFLSESHFSWMHNAMNILSVGIVASAMKICSKRIKKYLSEIQWLPHRLQKIGEKKGIIFVEDSKSTSSQSLEAALGSYGTTKNLLLIVGWSDKGDSFEYLGEKMQARVKSLVCIGETKGQFISLAQANNIHFLSTDILYDGVAWLYEKWEKWDVLMLSPWCASFGLFKDYLDRANQFQASIKKLSD